MGYSDLFDFDSQVNKFSHFSSLVHLAGADGPINPEEEAVLKYLAGKWEISDAEFQKALANPERLPINPPYTNMERLERLYDVLTIIFADHKMSAVEEALLKKYAVALGFSARDSDEVLARSIKILSGQISFEDYLLLLRKAK